MAANSDTDAGSGEPSSGVTVDLKGLDNLLGFHLRMAQVAFQRKFDQAVEGSGMSQIQFAVLWLIDANPGAAQTDLAGVIGLDRAGMMAVIDRLELKNLVVRRLSTSDRRRRELYLTEEGERAFATCRIGVEALEGGLRDLVSEKDATKFVDLLSRIRE